MDGQEPPPPPLPLPHHYNDPFHVPEMTPTQSFFFQDSSAHNFIADGTGNRKNKTRIARSKKSSSVPRFEFQTRSEEDILDDGYRWRKYGQKSVKNSDFPRSYYRCGHQTCNVKKQVQRLSKDRGIVVTTYQGIHNHPCEKLMETLTPLLNQIQLLTTYQ